MTDSHPDFLKELLRPERSSRPQFFREHEVLSLDQVFVLAWDISVRLPHCAMGEPVLLVLDDSSELLAGMLAVWARGGVPFTPSGFREESLRKAAAFSSIAVGKNSILKENGVSSGFRGGVPFIDIADFARSREFSEVSLAEKRWYFRKSLEILASGDDSLLEFIQMTSGSTGEPKIVGRTLKGLMQEVAAVASLGIIGSDNNSLCVATVPTYHAYGIMFRFFFPLTSGIPVYDAMIRYEEQFAVPAGIGRPFVTVANPGFLKRLGGPGNVSGCRLLISAGGRLSDKVRAQGQEFFGSEVLEIFGSTETGAMAWRYTGNSDLEWRPVPGNRFYVASGSLPEAGGEILMAASGEGVLLYASPYLENAGLSGMCAGREIPVFASGDEVCLSEEGVLTILGRSGRLIKIEDNRVSLDQVEAGFAFIPEIADAAVIPYERDGREGTLAFIVLNSRGQSLARSLSPGRMMIGFRNILRNHMLPLAVPRKFIIIAAIPLNANGKTDYRKLALLAKERNFPDSRESEKE